MNILFIGNINENNSSNGQVTKTLLYRKLINSYVGKTIDIDLSKYGKRILKLCSVINKSIRRCEVVFAMPGPGSCRLVLFLLELFNKTYKKRIVYCAIGTGFFSNLLRNKKISFSEKFFKDTVFRKRGRRLDRKILSKVDVAIFQTPLLVEAHKRYYRINNAYLLENFRVIEKRPQLKQTTNHKQIKLIYVSRISQEKGILDLMRVINKINQQRENLIVLDIYGEIDKHKNDIDKTAFFSSLNANIKYRGVLKNEDVIKTINEYDLFVFPTKYVGEGTPGVISEALIAGTPIISSQFLQCDYILKDGFNSILFKFNDYDDLYNKLISINKYDINALRKNAFISGSKYLFENNKDNFYSLIVGQKKIKNVS